MTRKANVIPKGISGRTNANSLSLVMTDSTKAKHTHWSSIITRWTKRNRLIRQLNRLRWDCYCLVCSFNGFASALFAWQIIKLWDLLNMLYSYIVIWSIFCIIIFNTSIPSFFECVQFNIIYMFFSSFNSSFLLLDFSIMCFIYSVIFFFLFLRI